MAKNEKYEKAEFTSCLKKHENMDTQKVLPAGERYWRSNSTILAEAGASVTVLLWLLARPDRWMRLLTASAKRG